MEKFRNPSDDDIKALLARVRTIAVVGLSPRLNRPSHMVASNLQRFGYRIIPIRPAVAAVLGEKAYANLHEVCRAASGILPPATLAHPCAAKIDMVDVFRAPEHVDAIVDECIALGIKAIWLQDGVVNEPAAVKARAAGITVVMDRCAYRDYVHFLVARRGPGLPLPPSRRPEALIVTPPPDHQISVQTPRQRPVHRE